MRYGRTWVRYGRTRMFTRADPRAFLGAFWAPPSRLLAPSVVLLGRLKFFSGRFGRILEPFWATLGGSVHAPGDLLLS